MFEIDDVIVEAVTIITNESVLPRALKQVSPDGILTARLSHTQVRCVLESAKLLCEKIEKPKEGIW